MLSYIYVNNFQQNVLFTAVFSHKHKLTAFTVNNGYERTEEDFSAVS